MRSIHNCVLNNGDTNFITNFKISIKPVNMLLCRNNESADMQSKLLRDAV